MLAKRFYHFQSHWHVSLTQKDVSDLFASLKVTAAYWDYTEHIQCYRGYFVLKSDLYIDEVRHQLPLFYVDTYCNNLIATMFHSTPRETVFSYPPDAPRYILPPGYKEIHKI